MTKLEPTATTSAPIRLALWIVGLLLVTYAISDHPLYGGEPGFGRFQYVMTVAGTAIAIAGFLPRWIAQRVLLSLASGLLVLPLLEITGEAVLGPRFRPVFQTDERLIFKLIPNRRSVMTRSRINGGETVEHRINSDGFRGAELLPSGAAARVVVYGDSFIHAGYSHEDETFAAVLGAQLEAETGRRVEVVNAGVSSYGPDQISLKMEDELPFLRPEIVVVAIFSGNDYGDLMRNKMFRLDDKDELVAVPWKLDPAVAANFETSQNESILIRSLRETLRSQAWFPLKNRVSDDAPEDPRSTDWDRMLEIATREYESFVSNGDVVVSNTHIDYYSADVTLTPNAESARYKVRLMSAVLKRIKEVAQRNRVPLVFLFIPHPTAVTDEYDWPSVDQEKYPDYEPGNQIAPLEKCATAIGVPFVDLSDPFRAVDANSLYYHDGDDHWNAAGQRLAAELVAPLLATTISHDSHAASSPER